jgi:hypothetical protein
MNDESLLSRLAPVTDEQAAAMVSRQALSELAEEIIRAAPRHPPAVREGRPARPGHGVRRSRSRSRRLPLAAGAATLAAVAVVIALILTAGHPAPGQPLAQKQTSGPSPRSAPTTPSSPARLDAWTVTRNPDGTVQVTIREMDDPAGLQAKLRAAGVRVVVTASLAWPAACREWRAGHFRMGDQVLRNSNRTGLPTAGGTDLLIRPSLIPARALLWLGISQTGKPRGVVGPPGPIGAAYLTATRACTRS